MNGKQSSEYLIQRDQRVKELEQQLQHLRIENAEFQAKWDHFQRLCQHHGAHGIGDLIVQRDEYKQDAMRYRWLRDEDNWGDDSDHRWEVLGEKTCKDFDALIDGWMREKT